ncbi:MAG: YbaB/EbfC family nucleoid-associated protein [Segniliparus sp.]|uniref:YbaB/EbfC family nucleoid-associated protein n=1 Tax=Segniliparus sp. TaxID=2804064 RepID=UPI003F2AB70F
MTTDQDAEDVKFEAELAELKAKQARAQENLAKVRGKGTAHNGHIVFEVDVSGKFLDLKLNPQAGDLRLEDLESSIKSAARAALADAAKQAQEAVAELVADPVVGAKMREIQAAAGSVLAGAQAPAPTVKAPAPNGPQPGDEDYEQPASWLERA